LAVISKRSKSVQGIGTISRTRRSVMRQSGLLAIQDPDSKYTTAFDLLSIVALANDIVITPYLLAWDIYPDAWLKVLAVFAAFYWTISIPVQFRIGFYQAGELKLHPKEIAKHYLMSSFLQDLILVIIDWLVVFTFGTASLVIRIARLCKLLRLPHLRKMTERLLQVTLPQYRLTVRMLGVFFGTVVFTHLMCCCWYATGRRQHTDTGLRWADGIFETVDSIHEARLHGQDLVSVNNAFRYLTSFHWTLAQITLGAMSIEPTNSFERFFCIVLLLTGMVFSATIVSIVSSQTMEYVAMRQDQNEKVTLMRRFLEQNHIEHSLQARVMKQLNQRMSKRQVLLSEGEVTALRLLSTSLRSSLLYEARIPHLSSHALFQQWMRIEPGAIRILCEKCVELICFKTEDTVFVAGVPAQFAYVVGRGNLRYTQEPETSLEGSFKVTNTSQGAWICEAALWCHWIHVGKLEVDSPSQLLCVNIDSFVNMLSRFPPVGYLTRSYARAFHVRVVSAKPPFSSWPNDLKIPHTDASDLMSPDVGVDMLQRAHREGRLGDMSDDDLQALFNELRAEKCAIQADDAGDIQRIVAVVSVRLTREDDDRVLFEVGTYDENKAKLKANCTYPGKKRARGELPGQTFDNIKEEQLAPFRWGMELQAAEELVEVKTGSFGLLTRYLKTEHKATLKSEFAEPPTARARQNKEETALSPPVDSDIYVVQCQDKVRLFAWLTIEEYEWFSRESDGQKALQDWVQSVDIAASLTGSSGLDVAEPNSNSPAEVLATTPQLQQTPATVDSAEAFEGENQAKKRGRILHHFDF